MAYSKKLKKDETWVSFRVAREKRIFWATVAASQGISRSELMIRAIDFYVRMIVARMRESGVNSIVIDRFEEFEQAEESKSGN